MQPGRNLAFSSGAMFLRSNKRIKDGKEHRYYTVVESRLTLPETPLRFAILGIQHVTRFLP